MGVGFVVVVVVFLFVCFHTKTGQHARGFKESGLGNFSKLVLSWNDQFHKQNNFRFNGIVR